MTKLQRFLALTLAVFVLATGALDLMASSVCAEKLNGWCSQCSHIGTAKALDMQGEKLGP
jgi:hypothetical protein